MSMQENALRNVPELMDNPAVNLPQMAEVVALENAATSGVHPLGQQTIRDCVERALRNYFAQLDGHDINDVYQMVLAEVEAPLLDVVLEYTRRNQSRAAKVLGLNRGTLRKKMEQYGML